MTSVPSGTLFVDDLQACNCPNHEVFTMSNLDRTTDS